jgi:hypothetical protein
LFWKAAGSWLLAAGWLDTVIDILECNWQLVAGGWLA